MITFLYTSVARLHIRVFTHQQNPGFTLQKNYYDNVYIEESYSVLAGIAGLERRKD